MGYRLWPGILLPGLRRGDLSFSALYLLPQAKVLVILVGLWLTIAPHYSAGTPFIHRPSSLQHCPPASSFHSQLDEDLLTPPASGSS